MGFLPAQQSRSCCASSSWVSAITVDLAIKFVQSEREIEPRKLSGIARMVGGHKSGFLGDCSVSAGDTLKRGTYLVCFLTRKTGECPAFFYEASKFYRG